MNYDRLQYLLEKKSFLGKTWDRIKNLLATAATLGLAHYGAKALSPKYDAFTKGVYQSKGKPVIDLGAAEIIKDLNAKISAETDGVKKAKLIAKRDKYTFKESTMKTEQPEIKQFIKQLGEKNYSEADKYLQRVVEDKLKAKIADQYNKQKLY